ncbi:MAG TPA: hypothetical protein VGD54_02340 [Steroidobacteraceae bacterium]
MFRIEPFVVPANANIITLNGIAFPALTEAPAEVNAVVSWARASLRKIS